MAPAAPVAVEPPPTMMSARPSREKSATRATSGLTTHGCSVGAANEGMPLPGEVVLRKSRTLAPAGVDDAGTTNSGSESPVTSPMPAAVVDVVGSVNAPRSASPARLTMKYAQFAERTNEAGGEPQAVAAPVVHEQRPSPPIRRAACMPAMSRVGRSPGVVRRACAAASMTG